MKKKFGIRKTKMNIFWLLLLGILIGVVLGIRQPVPQIEKITEVSIQK